MHVCVRRECVCVCLFVCVCTPMVVCVLVCMCVCLCVCSPMVECVLCLVCAWVGVSVSENKSLLYGRWMSFFSKNRLLLPRLPPPPHPPHTPARSFNSTHDRFLIYYISFFDLFPNFLRAILLYPSSRPTTRKAPTPWRYNVYTSHTLMA